jgi:hypothetical protein
MTGVVPVSGGRIVLSGAMSAGGRITPSLRSRRSLKVSPGRADPVERGSWRGSTGVLVSGTGALGELGVGAWAKTIALLPHATKTARATADHCRLNMCVIAASPARRARHVATGSSDHPAGDLVRSSPSVVRGSRPVLVRLPFFGRAGWDGLAGIPSGGISASSDSPPTIPGEGHFAAHSRNAAPGHLTAPSGCVQEFNGSARWEFRGKQATSSA